MYQVVKLKATAPLSADVVNTINQEPFVEIACKYIDNSLPRWLDQMAILCHEAKTLYIIDIFTSTKIQGAIKFQAVYIYQTLDAIQPLLRMGFEFLTPPKDPHIVADMLQINIGLTTPLNHLAMDLMDRAQVQTLYGLLPDELIQQEDTAYTAMVTLVKASYDLLEKAAIEAEDPEVSQIRKSNVDTQLTSSFYLQKSTARGILVDVEKLKASISDMEAEHSKQEAQITQEFRKTIWPKAKNETTPSLF